MYAIVVVDNLLVTHNVFDSRLITFTWHLDWCNRVVYHVRNCKSK